MSTPERAQLERTSTLYSHAFREDPALTYMLCNFSTSDRHAYLEDFFQKLLRGAQLNHGLFLRPSSNSWSCCAVVMPPGCYADNPLTIFQAGLLSVCWNIGIAGCRRLLVDCARVSTAAKAKTLPKGQKYYYVWFIATHEEARGQGLSSEVLGDLQVRAEGDGMPVWLEASTEYSMRLYSKLGFEVVEKVVVGKGVAASDGTSKVGGEGVSLWAMVWYPRNFERTPRGSAGKA